MGQHHQASDERPGFAYVLIEVEYRAVDIAEFGCQRGKLDYRTRCKRDAQRLGAQEGSGCYEREAMITDQTGPVPVHGVQKRSPVGMAHGRLP
jgi:hypothetical protein